MPNRKWKHLGWALMAFTVYWAIKDPAAAAVAVKNVASGIGAGADRMAVFVSAVTR